MLIVLYAQVGAKNALVQHFVSRVKIMTLFIDKIFHRIVLAKKDTFFQVIIAYHVKVNVSLVPVQLQIVLYVNFHNLEIHPVVLVQKTPLIYPIYVLNALFLA
jgi:predicted HAD superfamily hydrolase